MKHYRENLPSFQEHINKNERIQICSSHAFSPLGVVSIGRTKLSSLPLKGRNLRRGEELCCTLLTLYFNIGKNNITSVSLVKLFLKCFSCLAQFG